jgi:hypothetical protein
MDDLVKELLTRKQLACRQNGRLGGLAKARNYWERYWENYIQPSPKVVACRLNGRKGGWATARKYGGDLIYRRAQMGGRAVLAKYGKQHFVQMRKKQLQATKETKDEFAFTASSEAI